MYIYILYIYIIYIYILYIHIYTYVCMYLSPSLSLSLYIYIYMYPLLKSPSTIIVTIFAICNLYIDKYVKKGFYPVIHDFIS